MKITRTYLKIAVLANTLLKMLSKCGAPSVQTPCKLRFFDHFCLVLAALANFEMGSKYLFLEK